MLDGLTSRRKQFDLLPKYKFYVDFTGVADALPTATAGVDYSVEDVSRLVKSFEYANISIEEGDEISVGPFRQKTLGKVVIDDFRIEFYSNEIVQIFYNDWLSSMIGTTNDGKINNIGSKFTKDKYERNIVLYLFHRNVDMTVQEFSPTNPLNWIIKQTYLKCYPSQIEVTRLDYNEDDFMDGLGMTFKCNGGIHTEINSSLMTKINL